MFLDLIQTVLLVFIAWFIVSTKGEGFRGVFSRKRRIVLDSCSLIDGRIVEIITSGFVAGELIIPQFILNELQMLADGNDSHKRERARFGLDIAHQLQDTSPVPVTIDRTVFTGVTATDDKLVALCKKLHGQLYTTDYNLAKVAAIEGVRVLNVNELAQNLRPIALPGESLAIKILQKGSNQGQGVGYLDDGTMIVVEGGLKHIGRVVPVIVTRMHQTVAGKMVFGQVRQARQQHESVEHTTTTDSPDRTAAGSHHRKTNDRDTSSPSTLHRRNRQTTAAAPTTAGKLRGRLASTLRRSR